MAKLKINAVAISSARGFATSAKTTTGSVADGVAAIHRGMQAEVAARNNIAYRLSNIQSSVAQIENDIQSIYQTIDTAVAKYNNAERQIVGWAQQVANGYRPTNYSNNRDAFAAAQFDRMTKKELLKEKIANQGMKESEEEFDWKIDDVLLDVIGEAGVVGTGIGGIGKTVKDIYKGYKNGNNSDIYKGLLGGGKEFISIVGDLAENGFKTDVDWKEMLIGNWKKGSALSEIAEKTAKYADDSTIKALFKDQMDEFCPSTAKNIGENMKVGVKWAGVVISGVTNGIDNYGDYEAGKMSGVRAVAETISETAVDIAIGAGATVAVGAGIAALGISAPAVAVGAIAAGAVWALDTGVRWATSKYGSEEKGLTEAVSDFVLDTGEAILDTGKELVDEGINTLKGIGKGFSNVGDAVAVKWEACFG